METPKMSTTKERIEKMWLMYTKEFYSAIKKKMKSWYFPENG